MKGKIWILGVVLTSFLVWACSSDATDDGSQEDDGPVNVSFDRGAMLSNWADNIIIPAYANFNTNFDAVVAANAAFKSDVSIENLTILRNAWLTSYKDWQTISMFEIGPAEDNDLRLNINIYPTDVPAIKNAISSGTYGFDLPSNRDTKGFPAMDYLLNGLATTDAEIVAVYQDATAGQAHLDFLEAVVLDIQSRVSTVTTAWTSGYRDTFVANDGASATASTDRLVNDVIFYYEKFLRAGKVGIPIGKFTGTAAPNTLEAFYSPANSKVLLLASLDAFQDFFNGNHFQSSAKGESLASYLVALNSVKNGEELENLINAQLDNARDSFDSLGIFKEEIESNTASIADAYDQLQLVVPMLKVDMVSAMSIAVDFVDADGD
ncbi:imelysin family protein [Croceivirga sp. JEA036]|uniref:imelysin family protein n=1 Tax=Croceivirga sp. JEA036 TaxID=2721162 RepID=UPI00143CB02E|nr:imelysin family protein [Croceivirga sp. JEA036]NJB37496.1 imelysin family protein [Croceivirga sp. JEA036]